MAARVAEERRPTTRLQAPRLTATATSTPIAAYRDVRGAALAVEHLLRRGFHPEEVAARPGELHVRATALAHVPAEPRRGATVAAAALVIAYWIRSHGASATQLLLAAVVGALAGGVVYAGDGVALRLRRRRRRQAASSVLARRFEILVSRDHRRARHELARWWDPEALPAAWAGHDAGRGVECRPVPAAVAA